MIKVRLRLVLEKDNVKLQLPLESQKDIADRLEGPVLWSFEPPVDLGRIALHSRCQMSFREAIALITIDECLQHHLKETVF